MNKDDSLTVVKRGTNLTDNSKQTQATAAAGYTAIYAKDGASYASKLQGEGLVFNNSTKPSGYVGIGLGKDVTVGSENSIAIGYKATATNMRNDRSGSIAIGQESIATSMSSLALGNNARSLFSGGIAIGGSSISSSSAKAGWDSTSIGYNVQTEGARQSVAIGASLRAEGQGNIFLAAGGSSIAKVKGLNNVVIGAGTNLNGVHKSGAAFASDPSIGTVYNNYDDISGNVLIGSGNTVNGENKANSISGNAVFGSSNTINANSTDNVIIGSSNTVENVSGASVLGSHITVDAKNAVYLGSYSVANLNSSDSTAGERGMTKFTDTKFTTIFGTTPFAGSGATGRGVVTVGKQGAERLIQYVAPGLIDEKSTDAINGSQLYQVITHSLSQLEVGTDASGKSDPKITLKPDSYRFDIVGQNGVTTAVKDKVVNVGLQQATLTATNGAVTATNSDSNYTGGDSYATAGSVATAINNAIAQTTQQYQGDNNIGTNAVTIKRTPSDILKIQGEATEVSGEKNIGVQAKADGTLLLRLAKSLNLGDDGQLTIGNTVINKDGVTADKVTAGTTTTNSLVVKDKPAEGATDAKEVDISAGKITFKDNTGSADSTFKSLVLSTTQKGDPELGKTSTEPSTRLVFDNKQLATTNDGLSFRGDLLSGMTDNIINRKLNEQLVLKGGYGGETSGLTSGNIGIVKSKDTDNTELFNVQLSKDISQMNSIAFGDAGVGETDAPNTSPYLKMSLGSTTGAVAPILHFEGKTTTNNLVRLNGLFTDKYTNNQWAVKKDDDAATIGDLKAYLTPSISDITGNVENMWYGFSTTDGKYAVRNVQNSSNDTGVTSAVQVTGDSNIAVTATGDGANSTNGNLQFSLNKDVTLGKGEKGQGGTLTISGESSAENIKLDGAKSTIVITDGEDERLNIDGENGTITFKNKSGSNSVFTLSGKPIKTLDGSRSLYRIQMNEGQNEGTSEGSEPVAVATLEDGLKFTGNSQQDTDTIIRKLNTDVLQIKGGFALSSDGAKVEDKTTDKNTYVVAEKDAEGKLTGSLLVRLAKDLTDLNSASFKNSDGSSTTVNTTVDGNGISISITPNNTEGQPDTAKTVSLTKDGLSNGGNKITNLADGTINENSTDAVTGKQLYNLAQQYQGDNAKDSEDKDIIVKRKSSDILKITGGASDVSNNNNIGVTANATDGTLTLRLAKSLDLGPDGKLTIGNASLANDSIKVGDSTLNKDGLTATNVTATTVTGGTLRVGDETNGVAVLKATREGESSPVLQFGDSTTLPTYLTNVAAGKNDTDAVNYKQLKDLETSLTTTMGGGLTFEGNTSETWKRNLGDTVTIKGGFEPQNGETYTDKTTDQNTYVALETDDASKKSLVVRLAKELRDLTSAEFKNTDGITTLVQ